VAQSVGRVIALLFHDRDTRRGWVVSSTPRPHLIPGKDPVPILQKAGWAPGPVWTGGKCPQRDSIPHRPVCNQSLYQLSYPAYKVHMTTCKVPVIFVRNWYNMNFLNSFSKNPKITIHDHPSNGSRIVPWGRTDITKVTVLGWFQASAAKQLETAFLWVITQPVAVISYKPFGTNYGSHPQG